MNEPRRYDEERIIFPDPEKTKVRELRPFSSVTLEYARSEGWEIIEQCDGHGRRYAAIDSTIEQRTWLAEFDVETRRVTLLSYFLYFRDEKNETRPAARKAAIALCINAAN